MKTVLKINEIYLYYPPDYSDTLSIHESLKNYFPESAKIVLYDKGNVSYSEKKYLLLGEIYNQAIDFLVKLDNFSYTIKLTESRKYNDFQISDYTSVIDEELDKSLEFTISKVLGRDIFDKIVEYNKSCSTVLYTF